ncbi:MAG: DUF1565 domain-containing protein [Candidatus Aminicenantes bacterium]|nr:DUF1565 domain-containing protein [Candidatus Aminicenantes bacterium]
MSLSDRGLKHRRFLLAALLFVPAFLSSACTMETPAQPVVPPVPPAPAETELYADAVNGNDGSGDGSSSNPFRTIGAALQNSSSGMTVIVNPGVYDAALGESFPLLLREGVTLRGVDAGQVTVDGTGADFVFEDAAQSRVESLTIRGGRRAGVILRNDSTLASGAVRHR